MIEKLLSYLYQSYDKSPQPLVALRVQHADGFAWSIADRQLVATTEAGAPIATFDLLATTIQGIATALATAGCAIVYLNDDTKDRAGHALLPGSGLQSVSNGDALYAYDSLLWSFMGAYAIELEAVSADIPQALAQIDYATAGGEFTDLWGEYWGYPRLPGETDAQYRARTIAEISRLKVNGVALADAASTASGKPVRMYEPWQDLFVLSESSLDKEIIYDGNAWAPFVFRAILNYPVNIDWTPIIPLLERMRPLGVFQLAPEWRPPPIYVEPHDHDTVMSFSTLYTYLTVYDDRFKLDFGQLDDVFTANGLFNLYDIMAFVAIKVATNLSEYDSWAGNWEGRAWGTQWESAAYVGYSDY